MMHQSESKENSSVSSLTEDKQTLYSRIEQEIENPAEVKKKSILDRKSKSLCKINTKKIVQNYQKNTLDLRQS